MSGRSDALRPVLMAWLRAPDDAAQQAVLDEPGEPVREDVRRDAFVRLQQLAKMPLARKHHVAQHEQGPRVAEDLE